MRKHFKIIAVVLSLILAIGLTACGNEEDEAKNTKDVEQSAIEYAQDIAKSAKVDVEEADEVTNEKIKEAIEYIEEHMVEPVSDISKDVKEKIIYYGAYLLSVGEKAGLDEEHEIMKLGRSATSLAMSIYDDASKAEEKDVKALKKDVDKSLETINKDKEKVIDDVQELYTEAKNTVVDD